MVDEKEERCFRNDLACKILVRSSVKLKIARQISSIRNNTITTTAGNKSFCRRLLLEDQCKQPLTAIQDDHQMRAAGARDAAPSVHTLNPRRLNEKVHSMASPTEDIMRG